MIGDGLNDAGALMQADAGIAVSNNAARFTPACDAIIDGESVTRLGRFMAFAKSGKKVVGAGFVLSILYNFIFCSSGKTGSCDSSCPDACKQHQHCSFGKPSFFLFRQKKKPLKKLVY